MEDNYTGKRVVIKPQYADATTHNKTFIAVGCGCEQPIYLLFDVADEDVFPGDMQQCVHYVRNHKTDLARLNGVLCVKQGSTFWWGPDKLKMICV